MEAHALRGSVTGRAHDPPHVSAPSRTGAEDGVHACAGDLVAPAEHQPARGRRPAVDGQGGQATTVPAAIHPAARGSGIGSMP